MIETYRLNFIDSTSESETSPLLRIPVHLHQGIGGGLNFDGKVIQEPLISDRVLVHPTTFVPEITSEILS